MAFLAPSLLSSVQKFSTSSEKSPAKTNFPPSTPYRCRTSVVTMTSTRRSRMAPDSTEKAAPAYPRLFAEFYTEDPIEREHARTAARVSRRFALRTFGVLCAMSAAARMGAVESSRVGVTIRTARKRLDDIDALITSAKWDNVRTLLASAPLRDAMDAVKGMAVNAPGDTKGVWVGLREDMLSNSKLLDTAVYSNVFVDESREILGTKVDYDTPRLYLQQLKETYDELVVLADE